MQRITLINQLNKYPVYESMKAQDLIVELSAALRE